MQWISNVKQSGVDNANTEKLCRKAVVIHWNNNNIITIVKNSVENYEIRQCLTVTNTESHLKVASTEGFNNCKILLFVVTYDLIIIIS